MRFLGHPLHIMVIHFPSALLPMEFACYALAYFTASQLFLQGAVLTLLGGVILGWMAIIFGGMDLIKIPQDKPEIMKAALLHAGINTLVIIVYTVIAYKAYITLPVVNMPNISLLIVKALLVTALITGNYIGGNLILKHGIGLIKKQ